jgi:hypothetical protein
VLYVSDAGQRNASDFQSIFNDNTGDNIASLNYLYSELTAHYWVWRNLSGIDYVGFFHHRRYFNLGTPYANYHKVLLEGRDRCIQSLCTDAQAEVAVEILKVFDIITIRAEYNVNCLDERWPSHHSPVLWSILKDILGLHYPFLKADLFFQTNRRLVWYPMFITSWSHFYKIAQILFDVLERVYVAVTSGAVNYKFLGRDLAYLSEPLLMLIIHHLRLSSYEAQVVVSEIDNVPTITSC